MVFKLCTYSLFAVITTIIVILAVIYVSIMLNSFIAS